MTDTLKTEPTDIARCPFCGKPLTRHPVAYDPEKNCAQFVWLKERNEICLFDDFAGQPFSVEEWNNRPLEKALLDELEGLRKDVIKLGEAAGIAESHAEDMHEELEQLREFKKKAVGFFSSTANATCPTVMQKTY